MKKFFSLMRETGLSISAFCFQAVRLWTIGFDKTAPLLAIIPEFPVFESMYCLSVLSAINYKSRLKRAFVDFGRAVIFGTACLWLQKLRQYPFKI
ncbi:MAG: hypothetical protein LBL13_02600 [Bacteroidales bacterium]|nr:hypothetical protein [Bacteroidales bacterium]